MKYTIRDYSIIISNCQTPEEISKTCELFLEDKLLYSVFEYQVIYNAILKRERIIKLLP